MWTFSKNTFLLDKKIARVTGKFYSVSAKNFSRSCLKKLFFRYQKKTFLNVKNSCVKGEILPDVCGELQTQLPAKLHANREQNYLQIHRM